MNARVMLFFTCTLLLIPTAQGTDIETLREPGIRVEHLRNHVFYLASDELEGRRAGTPQAYAAAQYIAREFIALGLLPHPDASVTTDYTEYLQQFEFQAGVEVGENNTFSLSIGDETITLAYGLDFQTLPFSSTGSVSGNIIFAGFGISSPENNYDDYENINLAGNIAMVFQGSPDNDDPHGILNQFATPRHKSFSAREAGAVALLIITQQDQGEDALMRVRTEGTHAAAGLPVINITPAVAQRMLGTANLTVESLYSTLIESRRPNSFALHGVTAVIETEINPLRVVCHNVIGYLPGNHPKKKEEVIVIGAHYDHLGWGGQGSMVPDVHAIHHGADDNASGTAGLLELAREFTYSRDSLSRSMLFVAFGAEELGLIGSKHYVENPYIPNESTTAMINLDMIGRLQNDELIVFGVGTSPVWGSFLERHRFFETFNLRTHPDGFGPSDHASFYAQDIPVLFFHTGLHGDYHRPSDTAEKINYEGMEKILEHVFSLAMDLNTYEEAIAFTRADSPRPQRGRGNIRVYVGTMPDIAGESGGLKITGVREGSPAEKAGLKRDDVIIEFGGRAIENIYDYTYVLGDFNPGDVVEVVVKRGNEKITLSLELAPR